MKFVYLVQHEHDDDIDGAKIIGIFKTKKKAKKAVIEARKLEGFRDYPKGFHIDKVRLNAQWWSGGFIAADGTLVYPTDGAEPYLIEQNDDEFADDICEQTGREVDDAIEPTERDSSLPDDPSNKEINNVTRSDD